MVKPLQTSNLERKRLILLSTPAVCREQHYKHNIMNIGRIEESAARAPFCLMFGKNAHWNLELGVDLSPACSPVSYHLLDTYLSPAHRLPIACHQQGQSPPISSHQHPLTVKRYPVRANQISSSFRDNSCNSCLILSVSVRVHRWL
jgi:hypothetical protein